MPIRDKGILLFNRGETMKKSKDPWYRKKRNLYILIFILITGSVMIYHTNKPLPNGISFEGDIHYVDDVDFIYDLSYKQGKEMKYEQNIFPKITEAIAAAEEFIIIDMFLFNGYYDEKTDFPNLSEQLTTCLIEQKKKNPSLQVIFISDEVNTTYNSHESEEFQQLRENGIDVIVTDLNQLRDPNWLYSGIWRTAFQWFGQEGVGWVRNPFAKEAPKVTVRSYLKLLNVKANHRKLMATENTAIISSANPHDASGHHSNIAFQVNGDIIDDFVKAEKAVGNFSSPKVKFPSYSKTKGQEKGDIQVQLLTESKVKKHMLKELAKAKKGDEIWVGMFYLAERDTVSALTDAAKKGAKVKLILDPNQNAFGSEKIGLPNLPVAAELEELGEENMKIRWYNTQKEQFHTKLLYIKKDKESVILGGSTNYTRRNLDDYNLEANLKVVAPNDEDISKEVDSYFNKLWNNENGQYTSDYQKYQDSIPFIKYVGYRLQKLLRFETY